MNLIKAGVTGNSIARKYYRGVFFFLMKVYANSMGYNIAYANLKVYPKKEQEKQETHI